MSRKWIIFVVLLCGTAWAAEPGSVSKTAFLYEPADGVAADVVPYFGNGSFHLLFSTYAENPGWATRYMMAPTLNGPWTSPPDDFFDGGSLYAAVACVNDDVCLSVRMYDRRENTFGIWSDTAGVKIENMQLRSVPE